MQNDRKKIEYLSDTSKKPRIDRQTDRQTDTETQRVTNRQTERQPYMYVTLSA